MYDIPKSGSNHHSNHVLYNIPTLPAQPVGGVSPGSHGNLKSRPDDGPLTDPLAYDVPPLRHEAENGNSGQVLPNSTTNYTGSTWNGNGTYDIPKSGTNTRALYDIPTSSEKLNGKVIPGMGSSEHLI